ncbi:MAG TPA: TlpA disulfide reductase family protein [Vicinamibacterales bacterium]
MNKRIGLMLAAGIVMIVVAGVLVYTRHWTNTPASTAGQQAATAGMAGMAGMSMPTSGESSDVIQLVKDPQPVPDFDVKTLDGHSVTPASLKGKVAIINFWATWCGPCKAEIPDLIALQKKYPNQLEVVGMSVDEAPEKDVQQFVVDHKMNYTIAMAPAEMQAHFGGIYGIPTSFIVDQQGRVVQKHIGLTSSAVFEGEVRALLGMPVKAKVERVIDTGEVNPVNAPPVTDVPGIDLASLSTAQKDQALKELNSTDCGCGCSLSLARCRKEDPSCGVSLPMAKQLVAKIAKAGTR